MLIFGERMRVERLGAQEATLEQAMQMARDMECRYVGIDIGFGDEPHRRVPVSVEEQ